MSQQVIDGNATIKTDGVIIDTKNSVPKIEVLNISPEELTKLKIKLSSNPMILKAGIDGFLDTFDEFKVGQHFLIRSGDVSEEFKFKVLKINSNDEGHVSNIMVVHIG
jgi:hypothetical protein